MPNRVTITLTGVPEFVLALHEWQQDLLEAFQEALKDEKPVLLDVLRQAAPVAADAHHGHPPGTLRKGIRVTLDRRALNLSLRARSTAPHAHLVERGTVKMAARPTFVPTVIRTRARFNRTAKALLARPAPKVGTGRPIVVETGGRGIGI